MSFEKMWIGFAFQQAIIKTSCLLLNMSRQREAYKI